MEIVLVRKLLKDKRKEIELCPECGGDGKVIDDSWGSGASDMINCNTCDGTGRTRIVKMECDVRVPHNWKR